MTDARKTLAQAEREQMATYLGTDTPKPWVSALMALAGGAAIAAADIESKLVAIPVMLLLAALVGAVAGGTIRRAGAVPHLRSMPAPLRRVLLGYYLVAGAGFVAILAWAYTTETELAFVRAGIVFAVLVTVAAWTTDYVYRRRARRLIADAGPADD